MKNVLVYEVSTASEHGGGRREVHFSTIRDNEAVRHAREIHQASKKAVIPDIMETERVPVNHVGKAPYWKAGKNGKIIVINPRIGKEL